MEEIDIWRAVKVLIDYYGTDAELTAARRADQAIDQGDPEGERVWVRITRAVQELQRQPPRASEPFH